LEGNLKWAFSDKEEPDLLDIVAYGVSASIVYASNHDLDAVMAGNKRRLIHNFMPLTCIFSFLTGNHRIFAFMGKMSGYIEKMKPLRDN